MHTVLLEHRNLNKISILVIDGQGSSMDNYVDFIPDLPFSNLYHIDEQKILGIFKLL